MKKLLTVALVLALLAALVLPAAAAYPQILVDQEQTVTIADDESAVIFQFIPETDGYYRFYSYNSDGYDPYGFILDADQEVLASGDDNGDSLNFSISQYLTGGQTYYLAATTYSGSAEYSVQIQEQCAPTSIRFLEPSLSGNISGTWYSDIVFAPEGCAVETVTFSSSDPSIADVDEYGCIYFVSPGTATITATSASGLTATCTATTNTPDDIALDEVFELDASKGDQYLRFTAETDGWYCTFSAGQEIDVCVNVCSADFEQIAFDDDSMGGSNFYCPFYLSAGQYCYLGVDSYDDTGFCTVTVQKLGNAASIYLEETDIIGYPGGYCYLTPVYAPITSIQENLTWTSTNEAVATVDGIGGISFIGEGTATIKFTSENGKTDQVKVTVLSAPTGTDLVASGICGPQLQWKLDAAGVLTVTGSGDMYDYYNSWQEYAESITQVVFPQGITGIGAGAFDGCSNLQQVDIPQGVTRIGNMAFANCTSLAQVTLPDSITAIGYSAFNTCEALTQVTLPTALTWMGQYAFAYCTALEQVTMNEELTHIPMSAFNGCTALAQVTLPEKLVYIGDSAFSGCAFEEISLPDGLASIGYNAFYNCPLSQATLPEALTTLQDCAFFNCPLEEIILPAGVTFMGDGVFYGCLAEELRFLGSAPVFESHTFGGVAATVYYPAADASWTQEVRQSYSGEITWVSYGASEAALSGSVTAANGAAVTLELFASGSTAADYTATAQSGSYRFADVQPGSYKLTVSAENHVTRSYEITLSGDAVQDVKICLLGDVTGDGRVNVGDTARAYAHARGTTLLNDAYTLACADVTGDGRVNVGDAARIYAHVRGTKTLY